MKQPPTSARVRPGQGRARCPFCHDELGSGATWVACVECLARHHDACWSEGRGCATCGGGEGAGRVAARGRMGASTVALAALALVAAVAGLAGVLRLPEPVPATEEELVRAEAALDLLAQERARADALELALRDAQALAQQREQALRLAQEEARTAELRAEVRALQARAYAQLEFIASLERLTQEHAAPASPPPRGF